MLLFRTTGRCFRFTNRMGPECVDIHWMRHTGAWWKLHTGKTLAEALHIVQTDPVLRPNCL